MLQASESWNGRSVRVEKGEIIEVTLGENPTTGYRWSFTKPGTPVCLLLDDTYVPQGDGVPGQGGLRRLKFKANETGSCDIELSYRRSWEPSSSGGRTFRLHLQVEKGAGPQPAKPAESSKSHPKD